jgi:hypothetical protein
VLHSDTSLLTSQTGDSNPSSGGPEYFEAVPEEILTRVRFGQYINLAYQQFGIESKLIVACLLDNGKLRVGQLVTMVCEQYHSQRQQLDESEDELRHSPLKSQLAFFFFLCSPPLIPCLKAKFEIHLCFLSATNREIKCI